MRRMFLVPLAVGVIGLLVAAQPAAHNSGSNNAKGGDAKAGHHDPFALPPGITLNDEQKHKLAELKKEYQPKLDALHARFESFMTPERRKMMQEARQKAEAEGKKGKDLHDAVMKALKLSPQDQAKAEQMHAEADQLMKEIKDRTMALLTDEQRAQLKQGKQGNQAHKAGTEKKVAD